MLLGQKGTTAFKDWGVISAKKRNLHVQGGEHICWVLVVDGFSGQDARQSLAEAAMWQNQLRRKHREYNKQTAAQKYRPCEIGKP